MGLTAVDSLSKSITVVCDGRLDVVREVKSLERASDRAEVRIEQECLRILGSIRAGRVGPAAHGDRSESQP